VPEVQEDSILAARSTADSSFNGGDFLTVTLAATKHRCRCLQQPVDYWPPLASTWDCMGPFHARGGLLTPSGVDVRLCVYIPRQRWATHPLWRGSETVWVCSSITRQRWACDYWPPLVWTWDWTLWDGFYLNVSVILLPFVKSIALITWCNLVYINDEMSCLHVYLQCKLSIILLFIQISVYNFLLQISVYNFLLQTSVYNFLLNDDII